MLNWAKDHVWLLAGFSVGVLIVSTVAAGIVVVRLPEDYLTSTEDHAGHGVQRSIAMRVLMAIGKNILGVILLALGLLMSVPLVPGPGLVMLLVGILLLDFPGKRKLERKLAGRRWILGPLNWLRRKFGRADLKLPAPN